jgi:NAD(P)-dependent dehydrogenase (short-subunit alcohol dehydrogenase family)
MTAGLGLEGRCALVTAGTSESGRACIRRLRDEGMTVIEHDQLDLASSEEAVTRALQLGGGRLDVVVTNPGMVFDGSIESTPETVFRELLEANLTSRFRVGRASFAAMRAQGGGSMIHVASDAGIRADHATAACSVMSAGAIAVAELFAAEGAPHGIRSNAVCPRAGADAASVVVWLASDQSAHVSGATLRVDGGAGAAMLVDTRT